MRKAALMLLALISVSLISFSQDNQLKPGTTIISPSGVKTMNDDGQVTALPDPYLASYANKEMSKNIKISIDGQQVAIDRDLFMSVYEQNLKLNETRFKDVNRIQVGDTVILTALNSSGHRYWIANAKTSGEIHECIWLISAKYITGGLQTQPAAIQFSIPDQRGWWESLTDDEKLGAKILIGIIALMLLLLACGLLIYLYEKRRKEQEKKIREIQQYEHDKAQAEIAAAAQIVADAEAVEQDRNPENHPPVISGGLSKDDNIALQQICQAYGLKPTGVKKLDRVTFVRDSGPYRATVKMDIGAAGQPESRDMYVLPGEEVCKVTMVDDKVLYFKSHCGNQFGMVISSGEFTPPKGWREIPISQFVPAPAPIAEASNATSNGSDNKSANGKPKNDILNITIEIDGDNAKTKVSRVE